MPRRRRIVRAVGLVLLAASLVINAAAFLGVLRIGMWGAAVALLGVAAVAYAWSPRRRPDR